MEHVGTIVALQQSFLIAWGLFFSLLAVQASRASTVRFDDSNDKLVALSIVVNTTMALFVPEANARPIYDEWELFVKTQNDAAPAGVDRAFQYTSTGLWVQMETENVLAETAVFGTVISLLLAFVIILVSTMNILISLYAIFAVAGVVICFLGLIVAVGWSLGKKLPQCFFLTKKTQL